MKEANMKDIEKSLAETFNQSYQAANIGTRSASSRFLEIVEMDMIHKGTLNTI